MVQKEWWDMDTEKAWMAETKKDVSHPFKMRKEGGSFQASVE